MPQPQRRPDRGPKIIKKEEFKERVLDMRRVTRVVAGGKRFRFRATLVLGDEKGRVGIGVAKGASSVVVNAPPGLQFTQLDSSGASYRSVQLSYRTFDNRLKLAIYRYN